MGRLHLAVGTRYARDGRACLVVQVLRDGRLLVEDQSGGGQAVVTREELTAAWDGGALRFMVCGPGARPGEAGEAGLPTAYTIADFHLLPEAARAEAWRRYTLIQPLLAWPAGARTRRTIEEYLSAASAERARAGREGAAAGRGAASRPTVERYLRAFEASGEDIRALVPATTRGDAGGSRLDGEREEIIQGVLAECRAAPAQRTARDVYFMVVDRVRVRNQGWPPAERMALPSVSTIERQVRAVGGAAVLRRRPGPGERRAGAAVQAGPRAARPLERVELDHTPLDLIVVDEEDRLPIGRPTVTLALDVYSGLPTGVHVGFEAAGYGAAMRCLLHSILPKEDARARYGTKNRWPVYGLPEVLVVDHAPHLVGGDLGDACAQLGIHLDPSPAKHPWFKGAIERQFRTHNTGLVHGLPGTTFSNVLERGEYDSAGMACISLTRFREILYVYLLDVYGQDWNRGVGGVPATRWAEAVAAGWAPALHHDAAEVRILLGRAAVRTIQRAGIDHLCLRYQSAALDELRRALPAGTLVALKYDPEDLGALHVRVPAPARDSAGPAWLRVPAVDQGYAGGLSLWKHRVIRGYVRRTMERAVDVAALAEAKARIQGLVEEEFRRTRRGRRRMAGARYLGVGADAPPAAPAVTTPADEVGRSSVGPGGVGATTLEEVAATWDIAATLAEPGWAVTYEPPRDEGRAPWR